MAEFVKTESKELVATTTESTDVLTAPVAVPVVVLVIDVHVLLAVKTPANVPVYNPAEFLDQAIVPPKVFSKTVAVGALVPD